MDDYKHDVHLRIPNRGSNVYCLNGSAHVIRTEYLSATTCRKCKDNYHKKPSARPVTLQQLLTD